MSSEGLPVDREEVRAVAFRDGGVTVLETLTVLAGAAALALAPGVSASFVGVAVALLLVWTVARSAFGWVLPDGAARLANLLFVVYVLASIAVTGSGPGPRDDLAIARALAHDLILFLVLHTLQRRTYRSALVRLFAASGCFAVAAWLTSSPLLAPLVLVGLVNGAGAAMLLVLARSRSAADEQRRHGRPERVSVSRRPLLAAVSGLVVAVRLSFFLLLATLLIYAIIPRRAEADGDRAAESVTNAAADRAEGEARRVSVTGVSGRVLTLDSIGRIKRDTRARYDVTTRVGREPYVLSSGEAYFRTAVYTTFDGRIWSTADAASTHRDTGLGYRIGVPPEEGRRVRQAFELRLDDRLQTGVPALYRPFLVQRSGHTETGDLSERPGVFLSFDGTRLRAGDRFHVTSVLRGPDGREPGFEPLSDRERYLYTRPGVKSDRLVAVARVAAQRKSGVEAIENIHAWLRDPDEFAYTLDVSPPGRNPLERFLDVRGRRGHCELFATSLAVLGRLVGVPTRLVAGFRPAAIGSATFSLYNSDAHAWVEVWTEEQGWVRYDPTPSAVQSRSQAAGEGDDDEAESEGSSFVGRLVSLDRDTQRRWYAAARGWTSAVEARHVVAAGIVALALGAFGLVGLRRSGRRRGTAERADPVVPPLAVGGGPQVRRLYLKMLAALGRRGVPRGTAETPRELADRFAASAADASAIAAARELTALFESVRYAGRPAGGEAARRAAELLKRLERGGRHWS